MWVCFLNRRPDLHRRNRMSHPDPFQELVDSLRRVLRPAPPPTPPITSVTTTTTSSPVVISSPMAKPAPFSGVAEECNGFLLQCSLALEMQPHLYPTERLKITFVISLLSGRALQWAETIWTQSGTVTQSFNQFITHFREVFGRSTVDSSISDQLYHLRQGSRSVNEYALQFRTLNSTSIESPLEKQSIEIPVCYAPSETYFARRKPPNYLLIGHGTAQSTLYQVSQCPVEGFTHSHCRNRRPWRSTSRRLWNKVTSIPQRPLLLRVNFLWLRKTEAYDLVLITGHSTKSL